MRGGVDLFEFLHEDAHINFRQGEIAMAEQSLNEVNMSPTAVNTALPL